MSTAGITDGALPKPPAAAPLPPLRNENRNWSNSGLLYFLLVVSSLPLAITFFRLFVFWQTEPHTIQSGTWISLAEDLSRGIFYRPLYESGLFGGTRYFPLNFSVQAVLLKMGMSPRFSGHLVAVAGMAALMTGVFAVLRSVRAPMALAHAVALLVPASVAAQMALQEIRGDIVPAALNIWGLAFALKLTNRSDVLPLWPAGLLFVLAFSAKETTTFGFLALVLWFALRGDPGKALRFGAGVLLGYAAVVATTDLLSGGRFLTILRACASADTTLKGLILSPLRLLIRSGHWDPVGVPFLCLGMAATVAFPWKFRGRASGSMQDNASALLAIYFVATAIVTCMILGSPGTDINHLLDLHVAALLIFAAWISRQTESAARFGIAVLACSAVFAGALLMSDIRDFHFRRLPSNLGPAAEFTRTAAGPVLAHNPWISVLAGKPVYVQDSFSFRLAGERVPGFTEPLLDRIGKQQFAAVILDANPFEYPGPVWYAESDFGPGFLESLERHYRFAGKLGSEFLFLPDRK